MRLGVGLPTSVPGFQRSDILEWSTAAEEGRLSSLAAIDRVGYHCLDPLIALSAAASVTQTARLVTMILIGPLRNTAILAKQVSSLAVLAPNRLVIGLGIGARHEDYDLAKVNPSSRGADLSRQLVDLRCAVEEGRIGPVLPGDRPTLLVGGGTGETFARAANYADGYVHGGGPPRAFANASAQARAAWHEAGRPGEPQLWGQAYFALGGSDDTEQGAAYLRDYYRFTGGFEERIAAGLLNTPAAVRTLIQGYEDEGCDELVLFPTLSSPAQLHRLLDVVN